jgi:uncharacterized protein YwgA
MPERYEVLSLLLQEMGIPIDDLQRFKGRKRLQKTIYFAQLPKFGIDFGYGYSLYIHGPYSQELAEAGYKVLSEKKHCTEFASRHDFCPAIALGIRRLKAFIDTGLGVISDPIDFLELAATLHYLWSVSLRYLSTKERKFQTVFSCQQRKKRFTPKTCQKVLALLETKGLLGA